MMRRWLLVLVVVLGCKKGNGGDKHTPATGSGSGSGSQEVAPPPPAWTIESQPVDLMCADKPLALPAPAGATAAPAPRALPHGDAIHACQDQASVAAVCDCLVKSIKDWGGDLGLSPAVECEPQPPANTDAQLVEVSSKPADDSSTSGGEAFVFVARHGATWSPVAVIEAAPDVDLSVTPKASHTATLDRVASHATTGGTLYWLESHHEAQDKDVGDTDHDGDAHGTVCLVPSSGAPTCGKPLVLGTWSYAFSLPKADQPDACTIGKVSTFTATVDPTGVTLKLAHGPDSGGQAGRYTF